MVKPAFASSLHCIGVLALSLLILPQAASACSFDKPAASAALYWSFVLISSYSSMLFHFAFCIPISCPWYINGIPRSNTLTVPSILIPAGFCAYSGKNLEAPLGSSWFSMILALKPYFSVSSCEPRMVFLHVSKSIFGASYQPCSPSLKHCAQKSNIVEKWPFSPINSGSSSGFILNTSPTVNASYFLNVLFFNSSKNSPTPSALSTIL